MFFHCHNCNESMFFGQFLKRVDHNLYRQYLLEQFAPLKPKVSTDDAKPFITTPNFTKKITINLPTINSLPHSHLAKQYVLSRKLPVNQLDHIYYADCYKSFMDEILPGNGKLIPLLDKRIIIPFYDEDCLLLGFQGRTLSDSKIKYITTMLDESKKKVFGLDKIDKAKEIYVTEGPFDSMFLDNSIAIMDSSLNRIIDLLGPLNYVFVPDNEKRNKQTLSTMEKIIKLNQKIFIWPRNIDAKDINDLILNGMSQTEIMMMIDNNTFEGLDAQLKLTMWSK